MRLAYFFLANLVIIKNIIWPQSERSRRMKVGGLLQYLKWTVYFASRAIFRFLPKRTGIFRKNKMSPSLEKNSKSPKSSSRKTETPANGSINGDSNPEDPEMDQSSSIPTINAYMVFSHHMRLKSLQEQSKVWLILHDSCMNQKIILNIGKSNYSGTVNKQAMVFIGS